MNGALYLFEEKNHKNNNNNTYNKIDLLCNLQFLFLALIHLKLHIELASLILSVDDNDGGDDNDYYYYDIVMVEWPICVTQAFFDVCKEDRENVWCRYLM